MTRVLHVLGSLRRGGVELRLLELAELLQGEPIEFHCCLLGKGRGELEEGARGLGITIHRCRLGPLFPFRLRRLLRSHGFDAVHSHVFMFSGAVLRVAHGAGVPKRIASLHSTSGGRTQRTPRLRKWLFRRWIDEYATDIVGVSAAALAAAWRGDWQSDSRCQVIHWGIRVPTVVDGAADRVRREQEVCSSSPLIVHVGSVTPAKNHGRLLSVFAQVRSRVPEAVLLMVGRADEKNMVDLQQLALTLRLDDTVRFLGEKSDVTHYLQAASVMIFPSLWEGLPGAVLEALSCGTPVVASSIGPHEEIRHWFPALRTIDLDRSDEDWASAVVKEIGAPVSRSSRLAARAHFVSTPFSIQESGRRWSEVWRHEAARD